MKVPAKPRAPRKPKPEPAAAPLIEGEILPPLADEPERKAPLRLGEGLHDITPEEYHADPCHEASASAGNIHRLLTATPMHAAAEHPRLNPDLVPESRNEFDVGSAAHELLSGKGRGIKRIDAENYKTKAAQELRDRARADGYTPLTNPQFLTVRKMMQAARVQMRAHGIGDPFERAEAIHKEAAIIWHEGGVWNRCLLDCADVEARVIYDYKTTGGLAEPDAWAKRSSELGIESRARHYLDGAERVLGGRWRYRFIIQEAEEPFALSVVELSNAALDVGRKKVDRGREIWRRCLDSGSWPGFSSEIAVVDLPPWVEARWLGREIAEDEYKRRTGRDVLDAAMRWQAPLLSGG